MASRKTGQNLHVSKSIQKITVVEPVAPPRALAQPPPPETRPRLIYKKKSPKGKVSRVAREQNDKVRAYAKAYEVLFEEYLKRHNRSNQRRSDGWLFDIDENIYRAYRKAREVYNDQLEEEAEAEDDEDYNDEFDDEDDD